MRRDRFNDFWMAVTNETAHLTRSPIKNPMAGGGMDVCAFGMGDDEGMKWRWCDWDELAVNLLLQFFGIEVTIKTGSVHVGLLSHIGLRLVFCQLVPPGIGDEALFKELHQHHYTTKSECSDHAFGPDDTSLQIVTTICFWQCPTTALLQAIAGRKPYKLLRRRRLKRQR